MNEKHKEKGNRVKNQSDLPVCSRGPLSGRQTSVLVSYRSRAASNYMGYRSSGPPTNTHTYCNEGLSLWSCHKFRLLGSLS